MTAYGQTSVTGTAAAPSLKLLTLGAVVPIGNVDSTLTPGIPASLLSALTGGTMELRRFPVAYAYRCNLSYHIVDLSRHCGSGRLDSEARERRRIFGQRR